MASGFKTAFAAARKAGKKEFSWNGKSYNTELKETVRPKSRSKSEVGPKARPSNKVAAAAAVSPGGIMPDMKAIKAGNQAQRAARRDARANKKLASDVKSTLAATKAAPTNKDEKSKAAVKKAMAKSSGVNFR